jgi:chemotaxis family two-component system response regulator Rcp1
LPVRAIQILLAEDDPAAAQLTIEALRDPRVRPVVHLVSDGEAALDFLHRQPPYADAPRPDIILLDLNMPKIDGREVLVRIKANATLDSIPVIVLTSSSNPTDVEAAYRLQVAGYITKYSELDRYFTAIRSLKELWFNVITLPGRT